MDIHISRCESVTHYCFPITLTPSPLGLYLLSEQEAIKRSNSNTQPPKFPPSSAQLPSARCYQFLRKIKYL